MKVLQNGTDIKVALVGCLHGDELIGQRAFEYFEPRLPDYPGLTLVLAHVEAMRHGVRFIDEDLNRCFPGSPHGHHEEQLAAQLMALVTGAKYVLDLHTTSSDIRLTPIVTSLRGATKRVIGLVGSREVALMESPIPARSLIGNVSTGVSLEFNEIYARTPAALQDIIEVVEGLLGGQRPEPKERLVYHVSGTIPAEAHLPADTRNFQLVQPLEMYPFLLHERAYKTHQGFSARRVTTVQC